MKPLFAAPLLTALASTALVSTAQAGTAADEFGAHRWPVEPKLSVNVQPDLCKRVFDDTVVTFLSTATDVDIAAAVTKDFPSLKPTPAIEGSADNAPSSLTRLDLDLDGTGQKQVVIFRDNPFNWRGDWNYAYVFPSAAAFDSAKSEVASEWNTTPDGQDLSPKTQDHSAQLYYPSALTNKNDEIPTGDIWASNNLFEANKRFYFVGGAETLFNQAPAPVEVFRLLANGHVEVVCQIQHGDFKEQYQAFLKLPAMGPLLAAIRTIGAGGDDGGQMQIGQEHDALAKAAEVRAAYRPWAASAETKADVPGEPPYYRYDARTRDFLEDWSLQELWNRREYQTLLEAIPPAEASYSAYLQSTFGVSADAARLDAVKVIEALIGAELEIPHDFRAGPTDEDFPSTPLHTAVMRRDRPAFDAELTSSSKPSPELLSATVGDAVEWPYALDRLLSAGADPNHANDFGKTPLMVAAHLDRPDSVRRLIKAGANVNAATSPAAVSGDGPQRSGRTALMYAAENASPITIKALLDAGADLKAKDSAGNDISFYLKENPRLTSGETSLGAAGLAKTADPSANPSFACSKAQTETEKAICGSEVLRIFDAQIGRAFSTLKTKAGPAIVEEQRRWLQTRDHSCAADVDCLAEKMRTRLRYLLERLNE